MSYAPAFRLLIIVLLPLTLGWKIAINNKPTRTSKDVMVEFLTRHKFNVVVTKQLIVSDLPVIRASAGACRLLVAGASPDGWNREVIHDLAKTMDRQFLVYRGKTYKQLPVWLTVTQYWWSRYLHKLGLAGREFPIVAVAATASCNAERLPWAELGKAGTSIN